MPNTYSDFLASKRLEVPNAGRPCDPEEVNPLLFGFQRAMVAWAVRRGRCALFTATGTGKALASDTPVMTPTGTVPIASLRVGEQVIGADGRATSVLGVYPQGKRPGYRVMFSDDSNVVCDLEHLWTVRTRADKYLGRAWHTLALGDLVGRGLVEQTAYRSSRYFTPMVQPVEFAEGDLPLHPYVLGCLLGDGGLTGGTPMLTTSDDEIRERVNRWLPLGMELTKKRYSLYDWAVVRSGLGLRDSHTMNPVREALAILGLWGHGASTKFVPDCYKFAAVDTRVALIQGLLDTDGSICLSHGAPVIEFSSASEGLSKDFLFLVQSLGGKGRVRRSKSAGLDRHRVTPAFPPGVVPFLLSRKADLYREREKYPPARAMREAIDIGPVEMTCIAVDAADGLFIVNDFIVTHNTWMQIEAARLIGKRTLMVCPLAVAQQTIRIGERLGVDITYARSQEQAAPSGMTICNYEMIGHFDPSAFEVVVLDEMSCLKDNTAKRHAQLIEMFKATPFRIGASATPAPNATIELGSSAEFLGILKYEEMLARYFLHEESTHWRLKKPAVTAFYKWLSSWSMAMNSPVDLGFYEEGYDLPPLRISPIFVESDYTPSGRLFVDKLGGITERSAVRRQTVNDRVRRAVEIIEAEPDEQWIIWAGLQDEADAIRKVLRPRYGSDCQEVKGSDTIEHKEQTLLAFADGRLPCLISKASIAGKGLNLQSCARMLFLGLSDCYDEQTEILTKRGWMSFGKVGVQDEVGTINPANLIFQWQHPEQVIWEPYSGPMLHFEGQRGFDLLVTPNHRLFVQRPEGRYFTGKRGWHLKTASEIANRYRKQEYQMLSAPLGAVGEFPDTVQIPALTGGRISSRSVIINSMSAEDWMRLAGWYLSEGHCRPIGSPEQGRIVICQTDQNFEHRREIIGLLKRIGLHVNDRTKDITAYSSNLAAFLRGQLGTGSANKRIPSWMREFHPDLLRVLRDTMIKGDGCHQRGVCRFYRTNSKEMADGFQEICLKTGIRASVHERNYVHQRFGAVRFYDVSLAWQKLRPAIWKPPVEVAYEGMIGCVTVPNHVVIVRRNGIPVISGNSFESYYQAVRRIWRFGQKREVHVYVVLADAQREIWDNVMRKERQAEEMGRELVKHIANYERAELGILEQHDPYDPQIEMLLPAWLRG